MRLMYSSKNQFSYCFFVYLLLVIIMLITKEYEALDLWRYYDFAKTDAFYYHSITDLIANKVELYTDFIYFTALWLAAKIGISMDLVTALFMTVYYVTVSIVIKKHFKNMFIPFSILMFSMMFAPFILVQTISRNLAAISLCYVGIKNYLSGKYLKSIFWGIACVFTHFSMLMYIPIFVASHYLLKINISRKFIQGTLLAMLVFSFLTPSYVLDLLSLVLQGSDHRFEDTYGGMEASGALLSRNIGYGDKLPILIGYIYSVVLVFLNKSRDYMFWCLFLLVAMLSFFVLSSLMFTNRIMMLMTLFVAWNSVKTYLLCNKTEKIILTVVASLGCVAVLAHFYSYRPMFGF